MNSTESNASHLLDYAPPRRGVPHDELRHLANVALYLGASMALLSAYSYIGIRWGQWNENSGVLFATVTGMDFYDRAFIELPVWVFMAVCVVVGVWVLINVARRRWAGWWLVIAITFIPAIWLCWVIGMIKLLWDDVSP